MMEGTPLKPPRLPSSATLQVSAEIADIQARHLMKESPEFCAQVLVIAAREVLAGRSVDEVALSDWLFELDEADWASDVSRMIAQKGIPRDSKEWVDAQTKFSEELYETNVKRLVEVLRTGTDGVEFPRDDNETSYKLDDKPIVKDVRIINRFFHLTELRLVDWIKNAKRKAYERSMM
jgi:hypothetical protein